MKRLAVIALVLATRIAAADSVPDLVKIIENQPADMDRSVWKDKRRDAAKKLGQSKDKKAVPELIKLADSETFDIIGEIAIEGLGTLGDSSAVATLQKIVGDTARDKGQRDLARKSLAKLGASADVTPTKPPPGGEGSGLETSAGSGSGTTTTTGGTEPTHTGGGATGSGSGSGSGSDSGTGSDHGGGSVLLGTKPSGDALILPELTDDTLAAYERMTFAAGTANLGYDSIRKELDFNADVAGLFQKRIERKSMAWGVDLGAHVVAGMINPNGAAQARGAQLDFNGDGEGRIYAGSIYAVGKGVVAVQENYVSNEDNNGNTFKETRSAAEFQAAIGGGYGRLLDVGAAIRVRRLQRTLDAARALGKPIDAATSKKLQLAWWSLRGETSTYRALVATVAILREAGILLGEPDAGLAFEILNVLRDSQLFVRPSGFDVNAVFAEDYLRRPQGLIDQGFENGRVEQLIVSAGYGQQMNEDKVELAGTAFARLRLFAGDNGGNPNPSPWAVGASGHFTRFTYGDHGDPLGAFDLTGTVQLSTDDRPTGMNMRTDKALSAAGELGFTMLINQASGLRLAAQITQDQNTIVIGATLKATYGLLDGTFAK
jgi:hypothetical protein